MTTSTYAISPAIKLGRLRLLCRWSRFAARSAATGDFDFVLNAWRASCRSVACWLHDVRQVVRCNICGWRGAAFYPNVGPGYYERATVCPRCLCQDRHRALVHILEETTAFFSPLTDVLEVAPMRSFQKYCLERKDGRGYRSFDYCRDAMERGDLTRMHYAAQSCDYFVCFHVLEHVAQEAEALREIWRVLRPGGTAVLQVPIDWTARTTVEYGAPRPREAGHVRRYGVDFPERVRAYGFDVQPISVRDLCDETFIREGGLSPEPIYLAVKPRHADLTSTSRQDVVLSIS